MRLLPRMVANVGAFVRWQTAHHGRTHQRSIAAGASMHSRSGVGTRFIGANLTPDLRRSHGVPAQTFYGIVAGATQATVLRGAKKQGRKDG